jgi:phosphoadenosine phosphosulfate reductase
MKPPPVTLSGTVPTPADLDHEAIAAELEQSTAQETLEWMFENFAERHYIACSFQKTSSVTAHMASQINPEARFFYLDTEVLFEESYETRDRLAEALGVEFDRFHNLTLEEQEAEHGPELWNRDPDACCGIRKVEPMRRALSSVDCWVAGVRRADSSSRSTTPKFGWDKRFNLWKLNPLADWTERDVWNYIREHHLPYNPLHDHGYPSIGCTHCTKPVGPGGDLREGRWSGLAKTECGIN